MLARVISQVLNLRAGPSADQDVIAVLSRSQTVEIGAPAPGAPRWVSVRYEGQNGFAARRFLAQSPDAPVLRTDSAFEQLVSDVIWTTTERYDASITYRLGCKARAEGLDKLTFSGSDIVGASCSGSTVDCSGWVSGLFQLVAANVNARAGSRIFDSRDTGRLSTHSDGQIANTGQATGQVWSGTDIDGLDLRSGLLFGLDNGDYDWEGRDRVFALDHIVMGVSSPSGGYYITQSSSSGGGVNRVPWKAWRQALASRFDLFKVHCVDLLALGSWPEGGVPDGLRGPGPAEAEGPEPNPMVAAPG